jgi:hypothetical protein
MTHAIALLLRQLGIDVQELIELGAGGEDVATLGRVTQGVHEIGGRVFAGVQPVDGRARNLTELVARGLLLGVAGWCVPVLLEQQVLDDVIHS